MQILTDRQRNILDYLKEQTKTGRVPSFREIMQKFRFRGIKAVEDHLSALERKGYIKRFRGKARSIIVQGLRMLEPVELPIVGRITAGCPVLAEENIEGTVVIDRAWVKEENSFVLKVQGSSMTGAGIYDGDYAIIKQDYEAVNGDIVVALVDNETTLKRFYRKDGDIVLKPENPSMKPIVIKNGDKKVNIIGKVIGIYRKVT